MSLQDERKALEPRPTLLAHLKRLHQLAPDGPLPTSAYSLPRSAEQPDKPRGDSTEDVLAAHFEDPEAAVRPDRARASALLLLHNGTDMPTVQVGLRLLTDRAEPEDAEAVRLLGLHPSFTRPATALLSRLDDATPQLIWLAERAPARHRGRLIEALCERHDAAARDWLLRCLIADRRPVRPALARTIASRLDLPGVLADPRADADAVEQVGRVLALMTLSADYRSQIAAYPQAREAITAFAARASELRPSMAGYAMLLSLALDLESGQSGVLPWPPGEREEVSARLAAVLREPGWQRALVAARSSEERSDRWRADWARRTWRTLAWTTADRHEAPEPGPGLSHFALQVVERDPGAESQVETRVLVDGFPVVAAAFDRGGPYAPEALLDSGRLRATAEPHEVTLAEAWCTEGCCGALHVTIVREGDIVVWRQWRRPPEPRDSPAKPELPEYRFDAAQYDAALRQAERQRTWEWPTLRVARLLRERLTQEPELMGRWQCAPYWIAPRHDDRERLDISFGYPRGPAVPVDEPKLQFVWSAPVPPHARALEVVEALAARLTAASPTSWAELVGGSQAAAEAHGFPWPPPRAPQAD